MASPADECQAMWQWMSQAPGLSARMAMARKPFAGRRATSRRGGLSKLKVEKLVAGSNWVVLWARITTSWPCQWIGWATVK